MRLLKQLPLYLLSLIILFFTGYPFFFMVNSSFKKQFEFMTDPWKLPDTLYLDNYTNIIGSQFMQYFYNSMIITVLSVTLVVLFAALASYPLARMRFRLNRPLFLLFLLGMMIPVHTTLIPIYVLTQHMGLFNTLWALLGPYIAFSLPISIFIFSTFLREIPNELVEAARIDGAGHFSVFFRILFPLLAPATATVFIYNFVHTWNEFIFALVLIQRTPEMTLPLGLREFYGEFSVDVPAMMAALTLGSLPLMIAYFIGQEKIVKGLTAGALKG